MPEGLKRALTTFWQCLALHLLRLRPSGRADYLAAALDGLCQKVLSGNFAGKLLIITINHAHILEFYILDYYTSPKQSLRRENFS